MELRTLPNKIYRKIHRCFLLDIHQEAYKKLVEVFGTAESFGKTLEVSVTTPFGFYEIPNRDNVNCMEFLKISDLSVYKTIIFHNLVGAGLARESLWRLIRKLKWYTGNIVLMEHNAYSADWEYRPELFLCYLKPEELLLMLCTTLPHRSFRITYSRGLRDTFRNFFAHSLC